MQAIVWNLGLTLTLTWGVRSSSSVSCDSAEIHVCLWSHLTLCCSLSNQALYYPNTFRLETQSVLRILLVLGLIFFLPSFSCPPLIHSTFLRQIFINWLLSLRHHSRPWGYQWRWGPGENRRGSLSCWSFWKEKKYIGEKKVYLERKKKYIWWSGGEERPHRGDEISANTWKGWGSESSCSWGNGIPICIPANANTLRLEPTWYVQEAESIREQEQGEMMPETWNYCRDIAAPFILVSSVAHLYWVLESEEPELWNPRDLQQNSFSTFPQLCNFGK